MVSDTAMPKAAARLSDERKPMVRPSVSDHQRPIDEADIDLAVARGRRLDDVQTRAQSELDRLPGHGKSAADDRLAGDDRGNRRQRDQGHLQCRRAQREKRIGAGAAVAAATAAVWPA